jgi:hypothetical protein
MLLAEASEEPADPPVAMDEVAVPSATMADCVG